MKKSVVWAAMAMLSAMVGCVKNECADCEQESRESVEIPFTLSCSGYDLKGGVKSLDEDSRINWVDIFVSVDGGGFCRHRVIPGETSSIAVKKGSVYLMGAVANAQSDTWDVEHMVSVNSGRTTFNSTLYRLSENRQGSLVMAVDEFVEYTEGTVHFELKRCVNKCTVRTIKNMWAESREFQVREIYLAGILECWNNVASVAKQWYNENGYETSVVDHLVYVKVDSSLDYGQMLELDSSLYYLPLPGSRNFLVINVMADGVPMCYSLRLPNSVESNKHYVYDLTICHPGDNDMIPDSEGSILINEVSGVFDVTEWDETIESRGF
jgi:hypothetical protein